MLLVLQMHIQRNFAIKSLHTKVTEKRLSTKKLNQKLVRSFRGVQVQAMFSSDARKLQVEYMEAAAALTAKSLSDISASAALQQSSNRNETNNLNFSSTVLMR